MRTAIISDLHLGVASDEDVLRDPAMRRILFEEIAGADRLVLLGDVVELRTQPLGTSLARARPFFEELGEALGGSELMLVPGNHDYRLAEPLLDELSIAGGELGLEQRHVPTHGPAALLDDWLGGSVRLEIAYPGTWLRDGVYATHGHYMDAHLTLPRAECLAAATLARFSRQVPDPARPLDYERVLRPLYGFAYGVAQVMRVRRRRNGTFEHWWEILSGEAEDLSLRARLGKASFPPFVAAVNRLLRADFEPDVTVAAIFRSGVRAATESATRLGIDDAVVITGHSHRAGPLAGESAWALPGGGSLHNTGSWVFASAFHQPGTPPSPYWPGTVTWLEDDGPPQRKHLLQGHSHADLTNLIQSPR